MKKKVLFSIIVVLVFVLVGVGIYMFFFRNDDTVGTFKLEDYSNRIEDYNNIFPEDKKPEPLGRIDSAEVAKEKAEAILIEIYGESAEKEKPYTVSFDEQNQVWKVQGTYPKNREGGAAHILIQKADGKVLAIWNFK